ncbi:hydrolase [Enterococcus florum]|uniref:Hydrolase n=1 Tax=Enterococcus florum TaxID=2480627 RepID=A0A4P5PB73_9ENTE|nr:alpha/beta hydrolase [Enterococcus florum]GCF95415.1 hydrolase [Enterococcus florum]
MRKIGIGISLLLCLAIAAFGIYYRQIRFVRPSPLVKQDGIAYQNTPTVFIHGYQGNSFSFGPLLRSLENEGVAKKEMVITVEADGHLQVDGTLDHRKENPTIMVLFSQDVPDEIQQSQWVNRVMSYLYDQGIRQVNLVSHSMGGVSSLRYLLEDAGKNQPMVKKLVTIAAPFNDLEIAEDTEEIFAYELHEAGPSGETPIYQYFDQAMEKLPAHLEVLNVAGDLKDGTESDGSVSTHSAFSLRFLLESHTDKYQELLVNGRAGGHSRITRSQQLKKALIHFLWK